MAKVMAGGLLLIVGAWTAPYLLPQTDAPPPEEVSRVSTETPQLAPLVHWPSPRAPFDTTPITPFETVGGAKYEPF